MSLEKGLLWQSISVEPQKKGTLKLMVRGPQFVDDS